MKNKFVIVDLETTGNSVKKGDKIIQFAAVVIEQGRIVDTYSSLVNPEKKIPLFIEGLTKIDDHMVKEAPLFSEIAPTILSMLEGAYFVAHNVFFDLTFLQDELIAAGYKDLSVPIIDTVEMARVVFPTADSYQLNELAIQEGLNHNRPHQADSDAYVTAQLFLKMVEKLMVLPEKTLQMLTTLSTRLKSDIHSLFAELLTIKNRTIEQLPNDLEIFNGLALKKEAYLQDGDEDRNSFLYPDNEEEKDALLKPTLPSFERRLGQYEMMDEVYDALQHSHHAVIEAGTGVGKSLAYLIPAAFYAKQTEKPVMISTYTTLLQEQLLNKEIPLLEKMLPFLINIALIKGRNHYINLEKFVQTLKNDDLNYDTTLTKMQILVWLTMTKTGDVDELNLSSGGEIYWNKIKNDETNYLRNKAWLSRDYYLLARKRAKSANIIITNHSFLVTDLSSEQSFLPEYEEAIIDEAHQFVKAAGKHFGFKVDYILLKLLFGRLGTYEQKQLFYQLEQIVNEVDLKKKDLIHSFEINEMITDAVFEVEQFFSTARAYALKGVSSQKSNMKKAAFRFKSENNRESSALLIEAERFYNMIKELISNLRSRINLVMQHQLSAAQKLVLTELETTLNDLEKIINAVDRLFIHPACDFVTWIEIDMRAKDHKTIIYGEPLNVSNVLKDHLFTDKKSVILTSATLTVNNSFKYILNELGLTSFNPSLKQIASPFNYDKQVQLIIPEDLPEINTVNTDEYVSAITEYIISIAEATQGRMLILFTSHEMLKNTHELIKESGFLEDFVLIAQGITSGSRIRLMRNFRRFEKAILFGTSSFWEGVDIPGEDLSCLVIVRLPFSSPNEPLTEAKSEQIEREGGSPFYKLSIPEAVLRFKQGFGRLIRNETDRGIIIVFDRRLITKRYGKTFLQSIPSVPITTKKMKETISFIQKWL